MKQETSKSVIGVVLDQHTTFTMVEFCRASGTHRSLVLDLVYEGVLDPLEESGEWLFDGEALMRAQRARRLMRDLGVNLAGVALALDLLDELERLRQPSHTDR